MLFNEAGHCYFSRTVFRSLIFSLTNCAWNDNFIKPNIPLYSPIVGKYSSPSSCSIEKRGDGMNWLV